MVELGELLIRLDSSLGVDHRGVATAALRLTAAAGSPVVLLLPHEIDLDSPRSATAAEAQRSGRPSGLPTSPSPLNHTALCRFRDSNSLLPIPFSPVWEAVELAPAPVPPPVPLECQLEREHGQHSNIHRFRNGTGVGETRKVEAILDRRLLAHREHEFLVRFEASPDGTRDEEWLPASQLTTESEVKMMRQMYPVEAQSVCAHRVLRFASQVSTNGLGENTPGPAAKPRAHGIATAIAGMEAGRIFPTMDTDADTSSDPLSRGLPLKLDYQQAAYPKLFPDEQRDAIRLSSTD